MSQRPNPDLDDVFLGAADPGPTPNGPVKPKKRKRSAAGLDRDKTRRIAFKLLALLADLSAPDREKVLKCALRIHRA
jgi:hypothetical protein